VYKDKDRQREAVKKATQRYRAKNKDTALSGQKQVSQNARGSPVLDEVGDTQPVIPKLQSYNPMMVGYVRPQGDL